MNIPDVSEVNEKERRIREYLEKSGNDAVIIGRQDNFAWFTCGGNNKVVTTSEIGFTMLVVTKTETFAISQYMDSLRVFDDELQGLDIQPVILKWYEESREEKASLMVKGLKAISDIPLEGAVYAPGEIYKMHFPLTEKEIEKCRVLGAKTEEVIRKVADAIKPGMTEQEVEAMFLCEYAQLDATPEVVLIGSDERLAKYRHPNPSNKKIEKFVLLHPAIRKWGLHANITRMVYFGDQLPEDISLKYDTLNKLQAASISICIPGERFSRILDVRKQLLREYGFEDEWRYHYPGGITGYMLCDPTVCAKPEAEIVMNQAYNWFITITGVKVEELSINTSKGREVVSVTGKWPTKEYSFNDQIFKLPEILMK